MGAWAALGLIRPPLLILLDANVERLVQPHSDFNAVSLIVMTVLTVILGLSLVALALREALEIRLAGRSVDGISGFFDLRCFEQACEASLATARNLRIPVCLVIVQFDWFDTINKRWGAQGSDLMVREVADVVRAWQRESDILGRIAEDRFGILLVGTGSKSGLKTILKLREAVDRSCNNDFGNNMKFTLSISLAENSNVMNLKQLFVLAAHPLQEAKAHGGNLTFVDGREVPSSELMPPETTHIASLG